MARLSVLKEEFYPTVHLDLSQLQQEALPEWQHYYNWYRAHGSLKGKTPFTDEVLKNYYPEKERIQDANYQVDLQIRQLKPCL